LIKGKLKKGFGLGHIEQFLEKILMAVPSDQAAAEPQFTCRVWVKAAVKTLHDKGVIICSDIDALERECRAFAATNDRSQPNNTSVIHSVSRVSA
jgi:hypothetical protein